MQGPLGDLIVIHGNVVMVAGQNWTREHVTKEANRILRICSGTSATTSTEPAGPELFACWQNGNNWDVNIGNDVVTLQQFRELTSPLLLDPAA